MLWRIRGKGKTIMRIRPISDLHLKSGKVSIKLLNITKDDVVVIAGDVSEKAYGRNFIEKIAKLAHSVIYVLGNHEFYMGEIQSVIDYWHKVADGIDNLYVLENQTVVIDGVRFIGATLWTSMDDGDWFTTRAATQVMADYKYIYKLNSDGIKVRITTDDTIKKHDESVEYISFMLSTPFKGKTVVVTHHSPSFNVLDPRYNASALNGAFHSNLNHIIGEYAPELWIHGHTHDFHDLLLGETRVVCNPRGYKSVGEKTNFRHDFSIDI